MRRRYPPRNLKLTVVGDKGVGKTSLLKTYSQGVFPQGEYVSTVFPVTFPGIPAGSLVITEEAVDGRLRPYLELDILGQPVQRLAVLDRDVAEELQSIAKDVLPHCQTYIGKTMCTYDFYEGQGRLDGAFCDYTVQDKLSFLQDIHSKGIKNIEMESLAFAAMCHHARIKGAVVCVALLDRLLGDQIDASKEVLEEYQERPQKLVIQFIKNRLSKQVK